MVLVMVSPVHNLSPFLMWQDLKEAIIIDADVCVWNVMITTIQQLGPNKKLKKTDWIVSSAGAGLGEDSGHGLPFHLSQLHHDWWRDDESIL